MLLNRLNSSAHFIHGRSLDTEEKEALRYLKQPYFFTSWQHNKEFVPLAFNVSGSSNESTTLSNSELVKNVTDRVGIAKQRLDRFEEPETETVLKIYFGG